MSCPGEQTLSAFFDGELSPETVRTVESHLSGCDHCQAAVQDMRATRELLVGAQAPVPSLAAQARWMNSFAESRDRSVRRLAEWLTAAAAVLLVATGVLSYGNRTSATPQLSEWETAMVGADTEGTSNTQVAARWIIADLSIQRKGGERP